VFSITVNFDKSLWALASEHGSRFNFGSQIQGF